MKYLILVENTHSNFNPTPFTGKHHDTEKQARTELTEIFGTSETLERLQQAGLYFTIAEA